MGLRERKKIETSRRLLKTALRLFAERGFDEVSTAEIAAAADVSKMTLFNYFPTKEDLVMSPLTEHADEPARVVRGRAAGQSPVEALRRQFVTALGERDAATGLNDSDVVLSLQKLVRNHPALLMRAGWYQIQRTETLRDALVEAGLSEPDAAVQAGLIIGAISALSDYNLSRTAAGEPADAVYPDAVALAERAFGALLAAERAYGS
ncbi:TetR/AcrR family transcriptional regulator [Hamadaea tsunoensis]|uniref:TetR/AcrR family transcriptional regulator n=1 Tax=Hamadaea tsunoensis TaxID=53368 RepID=UPI00055754ED|nr:TetR/AcrR family transcriptional regulator [Hamadaea tsunoensis]